MIFGFQSLPPHAPRVKVAGHMQAVEAVIGMQAMPINKKRTNSNELEILEKRC